jgi:MFS family permease
MFAEGVRPAFSAMMVDVVPEQDRVRAYSLNYWAINLGFALAAIAAGFAAQADYLLLFVVDAATTLVTATITLVFLAETRPARRPASGVTPAPGGGMLAALKDRTFLAFLVLNLLSVLVILQHASTLPIAMLADGFSAATYGWVIAVNGIMIVFGQLFVPRLIEGRSPHRVLAVATLIVGAGFGLVAFAHAAWVYALTVVIWTLGEMLQSPSNAATVAALSPPALRGRYQGLNSLSWSIGTALAPILGGLALQGLGSMVLWASCFGVCALAGAGHLLTGPARERRAASRRTWESAEPTTATDLAPATTT